MNLNKIVRNAIADRYRGLRADFESLFFQLEGECIDISGGYLVWKPALNGHGIECCLFRNNGQVVHYSHIISNPTLLQN